MAGLSECHAAALPEVQGFEAPPGSAGCGLQMGCVYGGYDAEEQPVLADLADSGSDLFGLVFVELCFSAQACSGQACGSVSAETRQPALLVLRTEEAGDSVKQLRFEAQLASVGQSVVLSYWPYGLS